MSDEETRRRQPTLPGAVSLYEHLDKYVLVCLRDGRHYRGYMRSYDQYANLVLDTAVERLILGYSFCDIPVGILAVRGENVMLMGEIDQHKDALVEKKLVPIPENVMREKIEVQKQTRLRFGLKTPSVWAIQEDLG